MNEKKKKVFYYYYNQLYLIKWIDIYKLNKYINK